MDNYFNISLKADLSPLNLSIFDRAFWYRSDASFPAKKNRMFQKIFIIN